MEGSSAAPHKISAGDDYSPRSAWEENNSQDMTTSSFYDSFCKFTAVIKYLGFLPIKFSKSSSDLQFSIKSLLSLSSLFGFVSIYLGFLTWFSSSDPLVQIFMYLILLKPVVGKVLFFSQLSQLIKLLQLMDTIDRDKCLPQAEENVTKKSTKAILGFVLVTLVTSLSPLNVVTTEVTPGFVHTYAFRCHSVICLVAQLAVYYFICYQMCSFYDRYHTSLKALVDQPCEEVSEKAIEDHRIAHGKLVNCIRFLNKSFSPYLGYIYFSINIRCLTECYDVIYNDRPRSRGLQALQMIVLLVFVYYPAVITDRFIQKVILLYANYFVTYKLFLYVGLVMLQNISIVPYNYFNIYY